MIKYKIKPWLPVISGVFILFYYLLYLGYAEFEGYCQLLESQKALLVQMSEQNQILKNELVGLQERFQNLEIANSETDPKYAYAIHFLVYHAVIGSLGLVGSLVVINIPPG